MFPRGLCPFWKNFMGGDASKAGRDSFTELSIQYRSKQFRAFEPDVVGICKGKRDILVHSINLLTCVLILEQS